MSSVAGLLSLTANGERLKAKGSFTYNLGADKREGIVGADGVHGFKEMPQLPFIEGEITDDSELDLQGFLNFSDGTVTLHLRNGKVVELRDAWYAGEGNVETEESNVQVRYEGLSAREVRS